MNGWDIALLAVAGYVAVTVLVRLMIGYRKRVVEDFRRRIKSGEKEQPTSRHRPSA